ncbi:MAG: Cas10/Cmr2 second palm domain-containing protein [Acidimicrobiales bacterium]
MPAARLRVAFGRRNTTDDLGTAVREIMEHGEELPALPGPPLDIPFARPCDLCHARPAQYRCRVLNDVHRCCRDCKARIDAPDELTALQQGTRSLGAWPSDDRQRPIVEQLAQSRPQNYIAYLAADGNAVGRALTELRTEEEYRRFSAGLGEATASAFLDGLKACLATSPRRRGRRAQLVLPVLAGGDDLLAYTSPSLGVPLAVELARRFEQRTEDLPGGRLTLAVGVIIAHASTPFSALDEGAHRLQREAKRQHRMSGVSAVSFGIVHQGAAAGPELLEGSPSFAERRSLGCSAYSLGDATSILDAAAQVAEGDPPWTKLKQIDGVLRRDDLSAQSDWDLLRGAPSLAPFRSALNLVSQLPTGSSAVPNRLPWRRADEQYVTAFPDLVALAELL